MERIALDIDAGHLVVADLDRLGVDAAVEFASNDQTGLGGRGGDQLHHRQLAGQWCAAPGLSDMAEQPVLYLVPFRGPWRIVANLKGQTGFVS